MGVVKKQRLDRQRATAALAKFVGDAGSGGAQGIVPTPAAGDAAAGKFLKADGTWTAPTATGLVPLTSNSFSAAGSFDIVLTSYTSYRELLIELTKVTVDTNGSAIQVRFSTDGGANYLAGASDYQYSVTGLNSSGTAYAGNNSSSTSIQLSNTGTGGTGGISNAAGNSCHVTMRIAELATANKTILYGSAGLFVGSGASAILSFAGACTTAQDTDAIRFLISSGTFTGKYAVYGLV